MPQEQNKKPGFMSDEDFQILESLGAAGRFSYNAHRITGTELNRDHRYGGVEMLAWAQVLAANPQVRYADLMDLSSAGVPESGVSQENPQEAPNAPGAEASNTSEMQQRAVLAEQLRGAYHSVIEALQEYCEPEAKTEHMAEVLHNLISCVGRMDLKEELLYAAGAERNPAPENGERVPAGDAERILLAPSGRDRINEVLASLSYFGGIKAYQMSQNFKPARGGFQTFRNGSVPEAYQNPQSAYPEGTNPEEYSAHAQLYRSLAAISSGREIDDFRRAMQNMRALDVRNQADSALRDQEAGTKELSDIERYQLIAREYLQAYTMRQIAQGGAAADLPFADAGNNVWTTQLNSIMMLMAENLKKQENRLAMRPEDSAVPPEEVGSYLFAPPEGNRESLTPRQLAERAAAGLDNSVLRDCFQAAAARSVNDEILKGAMNQAIWDSVEMREDWQPYLGTEAVGGPIEPENSVSNIQFMMLQDMSFEEMLQKTSPAERKAAGDSFRSMVDDFASARVVRDGEERSVIGELYGNVYRTAAERIRAYRLPAGDARDALYSYSHAEKMYALSASLRDMEAALDGKNQVGALPGFLEGFGANEKDFSMDSFRAGLSVMRQFAEASVQAVDPKLMPEYRNISGDELLVRQAAGKLFVEAYGNLFAGKNAGEIMAGIGSRELADLERFMDTAAGMIRSTLADGNEAGKQNLQNYLNGDGPSPVQSAAVERELGYLTLFTEGLARTVTQRREGEVQATVDRTAVERGLEGTTGWERTERDKRIYGDDASLQSLKSAAPPQMEAPLEDLASTVPWERQLYALHRLGNSAAKPELIEAGSDTFDRMFARFTGADPALGNGNFANANPVYEKLKIKSPLELFFVDGKPIREYAGNKYPDLKGQDLDRALKAEIVAAAVSGKHHVEMARVQMGEDGGLQIGVSEVNLDLSILDRQAGFFRGKPSAMAQKLRAGDTEQIKAQRQGAVRSRFGDKVASMLAQQLVRDELKTYVEREDAAFGENLDDYTSNTYPTREDIYRATEKARIGAANRKVSVTSDIKLFMLSEGLNPDTFIDMPAQEKREAGERYARFMEANALGNDLPLEERNARLRNLGNMFTRATLQMKQYEFPVINGADEAALRENYGKLAAFSNWGIDLSQNQEHLRKEPAFMAAFLEAGMPENPMEREKGLQAGTVYARAVQTYVSGQVKDPADMSLSERASAVGQKLFLETYGSMFSGRTIEEVEQMMDQKDLIVLQQFQNFVTQKLFDASIQHPEETRRVCTAYLRGEGPCPMDGKETEKDFRSTYGFAQGKEPLLCEKAKNPRRVKSSFMQELQAEEAQAGRERTNGVHPEARREAVEQRGGAQKKVGPAL